MDAFILRNQSLVESVKYCPSFSSGLCPRSIPWRIIHVDIPFPLNSLNSNIVTELTLDAMHFLKNIADNYR